MDAEMYQHELASISEYGFLDPVTVRYYSDEIWEIVDGEHRWRAAIELGLEQVPVWDLGRIDDDTAKELGIVLNETRGSPNKAKLATLVADLATRRSEQQLSRVLPFSSEMLAELSGRRGKMDFSGLQKARQQLEGGSERWVERIYRLPRDAAVVLDEAIARMKGRAEIEQDWRALELIAADFLGSP